MNISTADLANDQVQQLLHEHLADMHANSPADSVYALDLSGLQSSDISVYTAWDGVNLMAIGALKNVTSHTGEIKSMRTHAAHIRKGAAAAILEHMIDIARQRGYRRLSLETGSGDAFTAALRLYEKFGFIKGDAFGDYVATEFNQFLHLDF